MTIAELLAAGIQRLEGHCDTPVMEAEWLLAHVFKRSPSWLLAFPERMVEPDAAVRFEQLLQRRVDGEPYAYVTGQRGFWMFELEVNYDVLIPRPETELLVERALERIPPSQSARIADLGTGSGAIAIALALERPAARITATDSSPAALQVAQANAAKLHAGNIEFAQGDWCGALLAQQAYDVIVSNPPYVASNDPHLFALGFEPQQALVAGTDGLDALRQLIPESATRLAVNGWLLVEHGADQGAAVRELFKAADYLQVQTWNDLSGLERVSSGFRA